MTKFIGNTGHQYSSHHVSTQNYFCYYYYYYYYSVDNLIHLPNIVYMQSTCTICRVFNIFNICRYPVSYFIKQHIIRLVRVSLPLLFYCDCETTSTTLLQQMHVVVALRVCILWSSVVDSILVPQYISPIPHSRRKKVEIFTIFIQACMSCSDQR